MYYAYILKSTRSDRWYYGSTRDIQRRIYEHNTGRVESTKNGQPWELIHSEEFSTVRDARMREKYFKATRNKGYLTSLLGL